MKRYMFLFSYVVFTCIFVFEFGLASIGTQCSKCRNKRIVPQGDAISYKCKKLQFIHTVNGDGSKTAKIIKRQC